MKILDRNLYTRERVRQFAAPGKLTPGKSERIAGTGSGREAP